MASSSRDREIRRINPEEIWWESVEANRIFFLRYHEPDGTAHLPDHHVHYQRLSADHVRARELLFLRHQSPPPIVPILAARNRLRFIYMHHLVSNPSSHPRTQPGRDVWVRYRISSQQRDRMAGRIMIHKPFKIQYTNQDDGLDSLEMEISCLSTSGQDLTGISKPYSVRYIDRPTRPAAEACLDRCEQMRTRKASGGAGGKWPPATTRPRGGEGRWRHLVRRWQVATKGSRRAGDR